MSSMPTTRVPRISCARLQFVLDPQRERGGHLATHFVEADRAPPALPRTLLTQPQPFLMGLSATGMASTWGALSTAWRRSGRAAARRAWDRGTIAPAPRARAGRTGCSAAARSRTRTHPRREGEQEEKSEEAREDSAALSHRDPITIGRAFQTAPARPSAGPCIASAPKGCNGPPRARAMHAEERAVRPRCVGQRQKPGRCRPSPSPRSARVGTVAAADLRGRRCALVRGSAAPLLGFGQRPSRLRRQRPGARPVARIVAVPPVARRRSHASRGLVVHHRTHHIACPRRPHARDAARTSRFAAGQEALRCQ